MLECFMLEPHFEFVVILGHLRVFYHKPQKIWLEAWGKEEMLLLADGILKYQYS